MMLRPLANARFHARGAHRFEASLSVCFFNERYAGQETVTDLSLKGCAVIGDQMVKCGDTLYSQSAGSGETPLLTGACVVVRWVLGREFGAEIVEASPAARRRLQEWVRLMSARR